jgi:hypothetical protein
LIQNNEQDQQHPETSEKLMSAGQSLNRNHLNEKRIFLEDLLGSLISTNSRIISIQRVMFEWILGGPISIDQIINNLKPDFNSIRVMFPIPDVISTMIPKG